MQNDRSLEDLLDFLSHASERGLMPAATAQALAVAVRNVFSVLDEAERSSLPLDDLEAVIQRFTNKRAKDFNPSSLKEYGRRVRRAVELYQQWKLDPANFSVPTRATNSAKKKERGAGRPAMDARPSNGNESTESAAPTVVPVAAGTMNAYQTAFPVRAGHVVAITNIPADLTQPEAERLAQFIRLLAPS
jgi:hypothetical protein